MDSPITDQAYGPDGILNKMFKLTSAKLQLAILKLFNLILSVGYFPDIRNQGLITPIFKNGDKLDPNNYRGICVISNLGKVFCSIINVRVLNFLNKHNVQSSIFPIFNIYINELATILEKSSPPGVSLHNTEFKCLLFADDLCLLSPTAHGLQ